ncbi:MAG TPA: TetR/AcrR family transcriptional regulator [Spirochaetia bacterium]|nr:TetR/AcrR family transcriptional regulator [Spirochaetia bacterium]
MSTRTMAKDVSHRKIRAAASRMLRREGIEATSVHKVMKGAGLTVGGFYAHFDSRQQMIRHAFLHAVRQRRDLVMQLLQGRPTREWLPTFIRSYLSMEHVEDRDNGCAWAALLSELPRADTATRSVAERLFDSSVRFYAQTLEQEQDGAGAHGRRARPAQQGRRAAGARSEPAGLSAREAALASLAMAFGHLNLARMAVSPRLRDEILATGLKAAAAISAAAGRSST